MFLFPPSGLFSATSGTAIVNGYDINTGIERIRGSLGLCPQHNMLFPSLTVKEHLIFFGMVRETNFFPSIFCKGAKYFVL